MKGEVDRIKRPLTVSSAESAFSTPALGLARRNGRGPAKVRIDVIRNDEPTSLEDDNEPSEDQKRRGRFVLIDFIGVSCGLDGISVNFRFVCMRIR